MQSIYDGRKVQVWEFVPQGLSIGKWSTGKHGDGVAVVKNVKTIMCQKGGTLPLTLSRRQSSFKDLCAHFFVKPCVSLLKNRRFY